MDAGLADVTPLSAIRWRLRPAYSPDAQPGSRIRNGPQIRQESLVLARDVAEVVMAGEFCLVVGGDCSLLLGPLLGALLGARRSHPISLIHLDGHSDFRHPGNDDSGRALSGAAGMDLALATGHGEPLLTRWPGISGPLVAEHDVLQIGERESRDPDYAWPDIAATDIGQIDVFEALDIGPSGILRRIETWLSDRAESGIWVHLDVDVLGQSVMPAVDCPGSPGLPPDWLIEILSPVVADPRCLGMTLTIYDPDRDPDGVCAHRILDILRALPFRR